MADSALLSSRLARLKEAQNEGRLTPGAVENIRKWLTEERYAEYAPQVVEHIEAEKWQELDDAFWTVIPFGTGGRRGRMYPIGSNAINDRTIGESALGLAQCVAEQHDGASELSCAIAYDTRRNSRRFAELCASVMVAAGFRVYFLDDYRSTPQLSFLVRYKNCSCGIMVTASHNPPSDNAVKVYWSTGGQVLPPHDEEIIRRVMSVGEIPQTPFATACEQGQVEFCTAEVDLAYQQAVVGERFDGPRDLKIIYSPLHGVGGSSVEPVLRADGFTDVELFGPHAEPDGSFPNVPENVSNPENPAVFDAIIERARETGAELILATDPDADRMGCAAPLTTASDSEWRTLSGNQLGALLCDFVLEQKQRQAGRLDSEQFIVTTLVTTPMLRRIADSYGVTTYDELLVGFKWIAGQMDEHGPDKFLYGTEESHGFLVGCYARDKDAAVACMLLAELAAQLKADGQTLHEKLDSLYWQHGLHREALVNIKMEGSEGMSRMQALMTRLREEPPSELAGQKIERIRDYGRGLTVHPGQGSEPLTGPSGNLILLDLDRHGNSVAIRPSGTEPKVKFYLFAFTPAEQLANLEDSKAELAQRLATLEAEVRSLADQV